MKIAMNTITYEGPSRLDGGPIVAIITGLERKSSNPKTGDMAQLWILRSDLHPVEALAGQDMSICGNCPHRPANNGTCYVNVGLAPAQVWRSYKRGKYAQGLPDLTGKLVRLGAYGDPAALPAKIIKALAKSAAGWTGYTHQWRSKPWLKRYAMASVDNNREHNEAQAKGWRTFRVKTASEAVQPNETICPASKEAGKLTTCSKCRACNGQSSKRKSITINLH